jgi:hypothetical protein
MLFLIYSVFLEIVLVDYRRENNVSELATGSLNTRFTVSDFDMKKGQDAVPSAISAQVLGSQQVIDRGFGRNVRSGWHVAFGIARYSFGSGST